MFLKNSDNIFENFNEKEFGYYLAGLFEGDGHIWIASKYDIKNYKKNPQFCITMHKNNLKVAESLVKKIGYGWVRKKVRENAIVFTITNEKGFLKLLYLLYNKLKTPKIEKINQLIEWLNDNRGHKINLYNYNLKEVAKDLNNYWLCGFTDADGCFYIRVSRLKNKSRVAFRFSIDQRMVDPMTGKSYIFIMDAIANKLKTKNSIITRKHGTYFRIEATSKESLNNILGYFDLYPLQSIKYLDYIDWKTGIDLYTKRHRINAGLLVSLKKLKNNMNSLRSL